MNNKQVEAIVKLAAFERCKKHGLTDEQATGVVKFAFNKLSQLARELPTVEDRNTASGYSWNTLRRPTDPRSPAYANKPGLGFDNIRSNSITGFSRPNIPTGLASGYMRRRGVDPSMWLPSS